MKRKKRRLKRVLLVVLLVVLLLPAGLYFLISTPFFIRSVVLPRVEAASGYSISAETFSFSPFSHLKIHRGNLKNSDGSLTAVFEELVLTYDLLDLAKERVTVEELTLRNPEITLTPPLPATADETPGEEKPGGGEAPPELNLQNIRILNGSLTVNTPDATVKVRDLEFSLPRLRNGEPVEPELKMSFSLISTEEPNARGVSGNLISIARFSLNRDFALSDIGLQLSGAMRPSGQGADEFQFLLATRMNPNFEQQRLEIETFSSHAGSMERTIFRTALSSPVSVDWSGEKPSFTDTTLTLAVDDLRLSELNMDDLLPLKTARVRLNTTVKIADNGQRLSAKGVFDLGELSGTVAGVVLDGWSAAGSLDASGDPDGLRLSETTVRLARTGTDALHVTASGVSGWDIADTQATLNLHRTDLSALRTLHPSIPEIEGNLNGSLTFARSGGRDHTWDIQLNGLHLSLPELLSGVGGSLVSKGSLTTSPDWSRIDGSGTLDLRNLRGEAVGISLDEWAATASAGSVVEPDTLTFNTTAFKLVRAGKTALNLSAEGGAARDLSRGTVSLDLETADLALLRTLAPAAPELAGILSGMAKLDRDADKLGWEGRFAAQGLTVPGNQPIPSPVQLATSGRLEGKRLSLQPSSLSWPETIDFDNRITLQGSLDAARPEAMVAIVKLDGDAVDLTPWLPPAAVKEAAPASEPASGGLPATEPELPDLPFTGSRLEANVSHLRVDDIHLRDFTLRTSLDPQRVVLETLTLGLNGAPVEASGRFAWERELTDYTIALKLDPVEVRPIVNRFLPEKQGSVRGVLRANADLTGKGVTGPRLREQLKGSFSMNFRDGQVRLLDQKPERNAGLVHTRELLIDLVTVLARALRLPPEDLLEPPVTDIVVDGKISDGRLTLENFILVNPEFHLSSKGRVDLAPVLPESKIHPMPVTVGVNTNLAKRLKIYREDRIREDRVFPPSFLSVKGNLGDPKIDVDKSVVAGLILSGVTERNDLGSDRANEILQGLGGLLSGEGPPPKPTATRGPPPPPGATPTPTPKTSDTERVLRGFQILRELRATPTPEK